MGGVNYLTKKGNDIFFLFSLSERKKEISEGDWGEGGGLRPPRNWDGCKTQNRDGYYIQDLPAIVKMLKKHV